MKKYIFLIGSVFILQSCVVSTAAKAVKTVAKVGYGVVKGTVNGVSWTINKAKGKIDEDRLDGNWKLVGVYNGTYDQFSNDKNAITNHKNSCTNELELISFKSNKSKFKSLYCESQKVDWEKYDLKFGKSPISTEKENYIVYNSNKYLSIIDVTNKSLVIEAIGFNDLTVNKKQLYFFEKK